MPQSKPPLFNRPPRWPALCLCAALLLASCSPQPAATQTPEPALPLEDCQLSTPRMTYGVDARCGTLTVYEDSAAQSGRQIELSIAVWPAVSRTPAPDALFLLAGGPGQAAIETYAPLISVLTAVHQKRDIVLFDQRGTGQSAPLACPVDENMPENPTPEETAAYLTQCAAALNADPSLYTTAQAVEDLEQVRAALGYAQIDLLGVSYGTRLAQAYARAYRQSTGALILDGVTPLDWSLGPLNPANAQRALDLILQRCAADPGCQAAFPQLDAELDELLARLESTPVELTLADPLTGEPTPLTYDRAKLASTLQLMSYSSEHAALLPLLIHNATVNEEYDALAAQYLILFGQLDASLSNGLYLSVVCSEDVPLYDTIAASGDSYLTFEAEEVFQSCQNWPHVAVPADFYEPLTGSVPTLLLSGEADPVTPPSNAAQVAENLTNARQIVVSGLGHSVFYYGCMPRLISEFLQSADPNALDTTCVEAIQPADFFINYTGSQP